MPALTAVEVALRSVQPAVRLVRARHLARVRAELGGLGDPLPVWHAGDLLLPQPDDVRPRLAGPALLRAYWRRLLQADVLRRLDGIGEAEAADKLAALGGDAAAEVRAVLVADHLVPADADDRAVYRAFAAVAAECLCFDPARLGRVFPLLAEDAPLWRKLSTELQLTPARDRLKPPGAAPADDHTPRPRHVRRVVEDASAAVRDALSRGNRVRAAVTLARAGDAAAARTLRDGLVAELARTLNWDVATADHWDTALRPLLTACRDAGWGRAARCLYDLQRIVTDLSGEPATLDPWGWMWSLGRRPLHAPTPHARPVRLLRHLTTARNHLRGVEMSGRDRDRLDELLCEARHAAEVVVRADGEPAVRAAVVAAGLVPATDAEHVALDAVAAEVVDRVAERGFARFADLRDAVARNALKLPDLTGPGEWWRGDALLRADRVLGGQLAGVYRPAESYLRAVHRATAAAFGTAAGRWLALWVLLPFGGGVVAVEFAKYVALEVTHLRGWVRTTFMDAQPALPVPDPLDDYLDDYTEVAVVKAHSELALNGPSLAVAFAVGLVFLLLIHSPAARRRLAAGVAAAAGFLFVRLPRAVWRSPPVRAVRENPLVRAAWREAGTAVVAAVLVAGGLALAGAGWPRLLLGAGGTFAAVFAVTSTPLGRRLEDDIWEALADLWRAVRHGLVAGLAAVFREAADRVERGLYAVDEWLRFRPADARPTLALKVAVATVWEPLAYLLRFGFYLLFEPQVNPVKHFPVVTVGHKLLLPMAPSLASAVGSDWIAGGILTGTPGVFGFVAWELKESWRLYAANRPAEPPPAVVGHHGETVRGLLVPGFRRGTVPKLFARLRRADDRRRVADVTHQRHAVEHAAGRFVERHLVAVLERSPAWAGLSPAAGPVRVGVRTLEVLLAVPELGGGSLRLVFVNAGGELAARVAWFEWPEPLSAERVTALRAAVADFCRLAGVAPAWTETTACRPIVES